MTFVTAQIGASRHSDGLRELLRRGVFVTKGVYLGEPPNLSEGEKKRLLADSREWRLLLQLASDDDLEWMWGDAGNLYWWIKESDLRKRNFEEAWFQFQCS